VKRLPETISLFVVTVVVRDPRYAVGLMTSVAVALVLMVSAVGIEPTTY
jgi:hypothetical protein